MKKVTYIDGIVLDHPLYISTEFDIDNYIGERSIAINGSSIMFVQAKGALTNEVQIYSKTNGWISEVTKDLLIANDKTTAVIVTFDDTTTGTYYYDHTQAPMQFQSLYDGCTWYTVTLNMLKG